MKYHRLRERAAFAPAAVLAVALSGIAGCSSNDDTPVGSTNNLNATFYQYLATSTVILHPDARIPLPPSGEYFSENTKHFDLAAVEVSSASASSASLKAGGFALYRPAGPIAAKGRATAAGKAVGSQIPGFKNDDPPAECLARTGDDLLVCLDEARRKTHVSYHDGESLRLQVGEGVAGRVANLVVESLNRHVGPADRSAIDGMLTAFARGNPAHSTFSAASHDLFGGDGYTFSHAAVTDGSRGDVNGDGELESHSTLMVEVRKPLGYERGPLPALDACLAKYSTAAIKDEYAASINAFVHLDSLAAHRRQFPFDDPAVQTNARMLERVGVQHETRAINHAQDANLLGHVAAQAGILPWSATEYFLHFQLRPETVSKYVAPIEAAGSAGDEACVGIMRSHLNPYTAIITGKDGVAASPAPSTGKVHALYQVPEWTGSVMLGGSRSDFCLRDASGAKIAILDASTGAIVPACEKGGDGPRGKITESACLDDPNSWAYGMSRIRTPRFLTAQLILTEMLLHDQIADYWSIKWYQNGWKAAGQVAVRGAGFVINTAIRIASGQLPSVDDFGEDMLLRGAVYFVNAFLPTLIDAAFKNAGEIGIAGFTLKIPMSLMNFALTMANAAVDNPTFLVRIGRMLKGFIIGFAIDKLTSTVVQIADSAFFEWQDYSNGSHPGCFNFND